ncbi:MAG: DNA gyrase inhibitor YacG [Beijerinckiaceae bacterium]
MADETPARTKVEAAQPTGKPCGTCGKPSVERFRPFCSARCADVDLHRWLAGNYAIPAAKQDDDED